MIELSVARKIDHSYLEVLVTEVSAYFVRGKIYAAQEYILDIVIALGLHNNIFSDKHVVHAFINLATRLKVLIQKL